MAGVPHHGVGCDARVGGFCQSGTDSVHRTLFRRARRPLRPAQITDRNAEHCFLASTVARRSGLIRRIRNMAPRRHGFLVRCRRRAGHTGASLTVRDHGGRSQRSAQCDRAEFVSDEQRPADRSIDCRRGADIYRRRILFSCSMRSVTSAWSGWRGRFRRSFRHKGALLRVLCARCARPQHMHGGGIRSASFWR